jgi:hypothetical protein
MKNLIAMFAIGFILGYGAYNLRNGDVIPVRVGDRCGALDTNTGDLRGTFWMSGDRCHIATWHLFNPL